MTQDLEEFQDANGQLRRCGSLMVPEGFVSAFPVFADAVVPYDDQDIRRLLTDGNRIPARVTFADRWITEQHSTSACNGHAGAALFSRSRWIRGLQDGVVFSGAYLYSLINGGQDRGSILEAGMQALCEHGCAPADVVTWDMIYQRQQPRNAAIEAARHKGFLPYRCTDLQQVRTALAMQRPVVIALQAGRNFQRLNADGVCGVDSGMGNHAVVVDDLVLLKGTEYMDMANSWGLAYGTHGRAYVPFDAVRECIRRHAFYTLGSTVEA